MAAPMRKRPRPLVPDTQEILVERFVRQPVSGRPSPVASPRHEYVLQWSLGMAHDLHYVNIGGPTMHAGKLKALIREYLENHKISTQGGLVLVDMADTNRVYRDEEMLTEKMLIRAVLPFASVLPL
jgi:hypothetical protein